VAIDTDKRVGYRGVAVARPSVQRKNVKVLPAMRMRLTAHSHSDFTSVACAERIADKGAKRSNGKRSR
jgi:hypothetical protein